MNLNKFFIVYVCIAIFIMRNCFAMHKIAIEGMPGAGKSISLIDLISEFSDRCVLFSETNPEPNSKWQDFSASDQGDIFLDTARKWTLSSHFAEWHSNLGYF